MNSEHITRFHATVVIPLMTERTLRSTDEAESIAWALAEVGPNQSQVTITAHTADGGTWANRHFTWKDGGVHDSGWRLWKDGEFIGGGELAGLR